MGGAERSMLDLASGLDRSSFHPMAALPAGRLAERLETAGVKVFPMPLKRLTRRELKKQPVRSIFHWTAQVCRLALLMRRQKIGLVHSNGAGAQLYGAAAASLAGVPSVWHCRDMVDLGAAGRLLGMKSAKIVCVSGAVREHLRSKGIEEGKTAVIYNGLAPEQHLPGPPPKGLRQSLGCGPEDFLIGMAAQTVPWKNHKLFIEAAARISGRTPQARFVIAGADLFGDHPGYKEELERLAKGLGLESRLVFTGFREDFPDILRALDLLVLPSKNEPFGRVIIEAMALEKPVVAVDSGGPKEIVRHGSDGLLVNPEPEALSDAVCGLIADPAKRKTLGTAGRRRAAESFDIRATVGKTESLYRAILGRELSCC